MSMDAGQLLRDGIEAAKQGRKAQARGFLNRVVALDDRNELAWLWLSAAVETDEERAACLERAIAINPRNQDALRGLAVLHCRQRTSAPSAVEEKVPWYFSTTVLVLMFFFCTPLWGILILADRRHSKPLKSFAGLLCAGYVVLAAGALMYVARGARFTTLVTGPAQIRFGSEIGDVGQGPLLRGESAHFADGTIGSDIAWVASLGAPLATRNIDIVLSMGTAQEGETVIASNPLQISDPRYDTVWGVLGPGFYFTPGTYTLRLMSGDSILAQGQFDVP